MPLDYRRRLAYGPGSVLDGSHEFDIALPGLPEADMYGDLATFNPPGGVPLCFCDCSDEELARLFGRDPAWLRRLVFFGFVRDVGDSFAWDPSEVTDPAEHEMAIYLSGGDIRMGLWRVASTFGEFLIDYMLRGRYGREAPASWRKDKDVWASGKGKKGRPISYYQYPW